MSNDVLNGGPSLLARPAIPGDTGEAAEVLDKVSLLHQAFELRAAAEPDAVALVAGEDRITCGELDARANQLARFLIGQGVGPEVRVAICAERTVEMVVAMYAVLKAGGAYVPVDPAYPEERQANILGDSEALLLLTQERLAGRVPRTSAKTVFLDRDWPRIALESAEPLAPLADESNLAYVIYTSGSTGRPKGVAIAHRSAMVLTRWAARVYSPEELSGVLGATSICFDMSIFELFVTPALGGRAILAANALSLPDLPAAGEVTLVNTVPSAIAELARSGGIPRSVTTINLGGEALRAALVNRLYETGTVQKVYNVYGPSEDTTFSTWALTKPGDSVPSIGWLLDGTWGHLLDGNLERLPGGEPGELYLGGEGLARGYLGRPDMTAERFVPDPFSERPGERMYTTGDLIRYRPDGELDYLGRIDHQVKIRGFRVELGEIEAALERHPAVGDTVVVALEADGQGEAAEKVLVAYVVPRQRTLSIPELREHLLEQLADYMVPSHFVVLDALPLNPNGKVDRKALPRPEILSGEPGERPGYVAPRTPLEAVLAEIWSEVLNVSGVGAEDHFFELGGHSLLAARAIARIHDVLGRRLPPRALFDAPTVETLAVLLEGLQEGEELVGIPVAQERRWIASSGQEGMWFSERLTPGLPLFTVPLLLDLQGPLDSPALQRSLAEIVRRHEGLRVLFREVEGRPVLTPSSAAVSLPRIDLRALPASARSGEAERVAAALGRQRMDLTRGPLFQGYLMELDERDHRLLITLHHAVADDWSIWVLAHDLAAFYAAGVEGGSAGLSVLPIQFADFAAWQQEWLEGAEAREQLAYWERRLRSAPEMLDLPTDRSRPAVRSYRGAQLAAEIPRQDAQALLALALRSGGTLFMAFLTALDALLHRYSGQEDLIVGTPVANRHRAGTQELIGLFTNTLLMRAEMGEEPSFGELLRQTRETVLEALGHQDYPFDRLVRELQPERSLSYATLAQVFLSVQNTPPLPRQLGPGLDLRLHELGNGTAKVDITIYLRQEGGTLVTVWEYASDLFDAPTIARMSGHFQRLLSAAVSDPGQRVSGLPLLTEAEGEQIALQAGVPDLGAPVPVHELFARQARRTPGSPAVRFEEEVLTFGELDARAEALAWNLRNLQIGPESRVALYVERSLAMVVAILGVFKAGAAYVPLDAGVPGERLGFILEDCGARALVAQESLVGVLPPFSGPVVRMAANGLQVSDPGDAGAASGEPAGLGSLAYVIYTSGSTGQPKGVMVEHGQLASYLSGVLERMALPEGASFATVSTVAADLGNTVIFAALATGGCLHVISRARLSETAALARYFDRHPVDCLKIVPSHLAALLGFPRAEGCLPRRLLIVGGEAVSPSLVEWVRALAPSCRILNHYGPTETTVGVLTHEAGGEEARLPLGKPLRCARVLVLDRNLAPVPTGVRGELYVGGRQVTRGYLGRPDLTAERFLPDPWSGLHGVPPGSRLYATGDRGRSLPDGSIEFLGRVDFQLKIRGFRVEPGEVEAVLRSHPGVGAAAVVARDQRLAAYVVAKPEAPSLDGSELRPFLQKRLPDPLVPTAWVLLPALPLTPNGKVDRKALPPPGEIRGARAIEPSATPRTPTEEALAALWAGVLGLDRVGVHESFFELGGHSLLAMQVISRVHDSFGVELPLVHLFETPTVAGLAAAIDSALDLATATLLPIEPSGRSGPPPASFETLERRDSSPTIPAIPALRMERPERPPLSFSQRSLWFIDRLQPANGAYNLPTAIRLQGDLDTAALALALAALVARHEALRTRFPDTDGEPWQEVLPPAPPDLPLIDLRGFPAELREGEARRLAREEARRPFDLAAGPLLRTRLFRLDGREHLFLLTVHHVVSDGWSDAVLIRDLGALYRAAVEGRPAELPPLPLQLADYAVWQQETLRGAALEELLAVWTRRLAGVPPLDLPTDHLRPAAWSFRGDLRARPLEASAAALDRLARAQGATAFMVLLANLQILLGRYTGQEDFAVGTPSANRTRFELENVVGYFVSMLPLRADLFGAPGFREVLARVRATALEAFAHQGLPFELLVEKLAPERDLARNPVFQVVFQFQHGGDPSFPGLAGRWFEIERRSAKFDLNFEVEQRGGRLLMACEYPVDLYEGATIQRLLGHFDVLLASALADSGRGWRDLPLLTEAEREQLLAGFNDTGSTSGPEVCLHQLFEAQAARIPDQVALVATGERLTYAELNERADRLARRLRILGLGPERLAGVLMDRTADLIVALLAVLKAGGAYAPLDPNYPKSRVLLMLETARATVLITRRCLAEGLPDGIPAVFLDEGWEEGSDGSDRSDGSVLSDNLSYVIFTSGSTGVPKGVAIQHRSAVAMIRWAHAFYGLEEYAGVLASTSICFDMSVFEIFATLAAGGRILLAENALALPDLEARDEVVLIDTVPSAMAELLRIGRLPASVRTVNLGGEALKGSLVQEIYEKLPSVERVVNLYGPSEDTTFTSCAVVPRDSRHPLIGRPLTGESAYVLDREMRLVPVGVPGALYMGGEGVTRGYLHRPDLTAERFIPNPYGPPGSRLYQVGDLVRYLPTGELDFLGRLDHQVKVRGFRIELGEIESALTRHPAVREAAVLASPDAGGGNRLTAYVAVERDVPAGELRSFLKQSLPDYMVPSAFVLLPEMPLTPNGKIDRRALTAIQIQPEGTEEGRAPQTYAEEVLAGIWSEIFGRPVGVEDEFFDLGGHSLMATRVISRVRDAFGVELPVRRLFERPTVALLAESVEAALGAGGGVPGGDAPPIEPVPRIGPLPLSFAQRRLWFLDQLDPGSPVYNLPYPLEIAGPLDVAVLGRALDEVVRRHEALRTTFPSNPADTGEPYQEIVPAGPVPLPVIDVRDGDAEALIQKDSLRPFNLETGPLFRTALLKLGPERHVLLLTMHHIVSDGWSLDVLLRELLSLYEAFAQGRPSPLPDLPVQYADFAVWQRRWLAGEVLSRQLDYWRRRLAGAPAGLDLPADFPRPAVQTFNGASCSAEMSAGASAGLHAFCRREGVTLFMLLLAAFDVLLARYSGQEDVLVGLPVANRNRGEIEGLIGFFVNTLVLRSDLGSASGFRTLLRQVRENALSAYGHQDLPFETLVEELRPERDLSRSPFFQVLLLVQEARRERPSLQDLEISPVELEATTAKLDLSLAAIDSDSALRTEVDYNTSLFERTTIVRLLGHLGRLLAAAVADPERSWRDLPLLTEPEREQLLVGFNDTGSTSGPGACLHQLFEAQAARIPDQVALVVAGDRLTYGELNERADRLARHLRALGLGPEQLAGVLLDRTADLIVALLAVLKAGGAYAPLDPNYPKSRVLLMLETARATVLVTRRSLAEGLPDGIPAVFLDEGWEDGSDGSDGSVLPDNLAYVIFTSGSTGVPKGVAIQHRSAVAMIRWAHGFYGPEEYAGLLASTSICFDMSVFEIFATLAAGGRILLAENALALPDLEARDEVVLIDTVPSAMAELLRTGRLPASVRTVNLGGEALKGSLVQEIYEKLPSVERVVNLYGPSEDTTFTTYAVVPRDCAHPLIGRPLTGESAYVLDREMRPVPVGVPGALYMGGEGVTRGYLHRPDLTAERFIPNPYGPPGSRLYQVGDLVRYLPTGELDFLGRLDHQVKVRGFRIELGEIEAALTRHPEIREAAVLASPDALGGNRLIAYVATERDLAAGDLRSCLKQTLPDYMVPSAFVPLRQMPLTPNGKIDRRALAAIPLQPEAVEEGRAPKSHAEEVLAGIWSEIFGRPVGVDDDFFDLGGHSLMATRVASRVREAFGIELPVRRLFEQPTVAQLAESVEAALNAGRAQETGRIEPAPRTGPLPLSFAQRRLWFLDQLMPGSAVYNIPCPLEIAGPLDVAVLGRALDEIVRRHEALRTTFPSSPADTEPNQEIAPAGPVPLPVIDVEDAEAGALIRSESLRPFDLQAGPLFRVGLLKLGPERHVLLMTMHHIVSDGWSIEILLHELAALYEAFAAGRPSPLPELPVQYADFAVWQRRWLAGEALSRQLGYWREQLAGAPAGLDLPTDFPRPAVQTFNGDTCSTELPSADLHTFCRREGVTLFMLLLAGFDVLLARYSGQEDVLVGSPVANRNRAEIEGLIGFFVNTLVLRSDLGAAPSFRALLGQVRESALAAYGHQDLPFETLVEELRPERHLSRSPFFQVLLSLHTEGELPDLGGLELSPAGGDLDSAKFDLSLFVTNERVTAEYNTDLFTGLTIQRLLGHLGCLLSAAVAEPERSWRDLPLLTEAEREQLLVGFNETGSTSGPGACLHQLFEAQAVRTPDQVALVVAGERLTYAELNERADRLARRLRALGLGPERLAGVLLDRTADLIVALLAVLKAGGAYAPLDPNYPQSRVLLMLETARAMVLVTRRSLAEGLPAGPQTVFLDEGWEERSDRSDGSVLADNLAYVIFTSGSTGVPKGVAIQHRNAVAMVRWAHTMYSPEEYAGVLASTSICFDMSVFEIFATLAAGGRILLAENALALPDLGTRDEVVLIDTVPSAMAELLRSGRLPASVRTVNLGGEALKGSLVQEIYEKLPSVERVVNLYGPSEDTTFTSYAVVPRDCAHPLIGRPLTGEAAYVLDREMRPVPIGVPGALYMGGEGVTRGYLHRPDLTAERFIPNPYGPPGSRLYQVGDLVRYLPTGELDFLGRLDHQVKVRGFRIELGEIESALTRHAEVREAAVLAVPDALGGNRLIAYFETERDLAAGDLRSYLKQTLPDYMVPSAFVPLREMPLTPNGKIDRRALSAIPLQTESVEEGRAPRSYRSYRGHAEEVLVGLWSELFGHPVKVEDNFFDLGGHSLLATRLVSRIRASLNVELPLQQVFTEPTLEGLAARIEGMTASRRDVPPIARASREEELPLSLGQQRLWFLDRLEPGKATFNLPVPLRLRGPLGVPALSRALDEIVRRHEALRTRFGEQAGRGYQEILPAASVPLPWIDLSGLPSPETEGERLAAAEARQPFDLTRGPLLRTRLLRLGAEDWVLLVTLHHIVTDGWSTGIFVRELRTLYEAFAAGLPSPLPELPLQYPDFAVWQRRTLSGEAIGALLEDWKRRFGTEVPDLRLPTDRPRPPVQTYPGAHRSSRLSAELTRDLHKLAQRSEVTLFMALLSAFQVLLHRYSGQERVVVGSPVAGRNRPELEGLIGFFVNTLVLPGDFPGDGSGGLTFRQVLDRTREMALGAYDCQDLPFEKLVEALQPVRDNSRSPLFQVMFLLGQHGAEPMFEGLEGTIRVEHYGTETGTSQFDLTLFAAETPEGLQIGVEYNTDLFDAATMDRMLEHYRNLLAAVAADPGVRLEDIPVPPLTEMKTVEAIPLPETPETKPESSVDARRDRLSSRMSKLPSAQRAVLERRLKASAQTPASAAAPASGKCLVEIVPGTDRRPFFCIHPAGGDVLCFFPLARHIGQPFYGLQARGLEDEGEPFATIEEMAAHYLTEIRAVQPSGPYRIGGWSFGGLAAFELARQLREAGEEVEVLAIVDTGPGVEDGEAPMSDPAETAGDNTLDNTGWLLTIAEYVKGLRGKDLEVTAADLEPLDSEAQLRFFVERLQRAGITHSGDSLAQLRRLLRVYKTNVRAYRRYVPRPYPGAITLIRAEGANFDPALGPDLGWEKLSPHPIDRETVPGDHITLLAEPHVRTLAERLRARLGGSERP